MACDHGQPAGCFRARGGTGPGGFGWQRVNRFFKLQILDRGYDPERLSDSPAHGVERDHPAFIRCLNLLLCVVGILVFIFNRKGRSELCLAGFAFLMAAVFAIGTRAMQLVEDEFSSAKVAELIDCSGAVRKAS